MLSPDPDPKGNGEKETVFPSTLEAIVPLILLALNLLIYWQVTRHGFLNYLDDPILVNNPHVRGGISPEGAAWCFRIVEGGSTSRLEVMQDVPPGKIWYWFEQVDMVKAKEILGGKVCIGGNVPLSLLTTGTPDQVRECCNRLIDTVGKDGGYIMSAADSPEDAKVENMKAMIDFTKEYGVYR